jgi:hypothetical protein
MTLLQACPREGVDAYFACEVWARREIDEKQRPLGDVFHEKHERLERMLDECADP